MVRTLCFHCKELGLIPGWETDIPQVSPCSKKKKKKKKNNPKQTNQKIWDGQGNLTGKAIFEQKQEGKKEKHKEILLSDHMS